MFVIHPQDRRRTHIVASDRWWSDILTRREAEQRGCKRLVMLCFEGQAGSVVALRVRGDPVDQVGGVYCGRLYALTPRAIQRADRKRRRARRARRGW